ncbi:hypothetical protein [Achromobacter xylosoxidans]|uniref:Lipoprotein n=1 Tax=Alcaligenes xylosoxydans xylosoxydans TaxID=85698 RepID=A0A1R1JLL5_ALCXX|nr:hypothetical protein [Achromobacter xylosoxidans]OMG79077.1 hypothetical protein BIZ92_32740 [Achromobacter xylosoxidans]BEG73995.1 hypothetical protein HBIAX_01042 [Achromobacter xylosoxidans]
MKRFTGRMVGVALALALASSPALAGGYRGGHHGGYHHHHGGGGGGSGWWIGGAFALAATGLILAANSGPSYAQTGVYAPGVSYTSPPVYAAPLYETPPVYSAPPVYQEPAQYAPVQYEAAPPADTAQASASTDCQRWAMNQSGYDPATISQWTTQVMVDSYNHAMDSCMNSRGYRAN